MLVVVLIAVAVIILIYAKLGKQRRKAGIRGWVIDQDLDGKGSRVYRDQKLGVSCKPDVVERNRLIEYKSATVHGKARYGDILHVAAQMIATGKNEAELRYANRKFVLSRYSGQMQSAMHQVCSISAQMRRHLSMGIAPKRTASVTRSSLCGRQNSSAM